MKTHDEFIKKYKELEQALDVPVKDYEMSLPDDERQKLHVCRVIRNYVQHNDDYNSFIEISEGMMKFLANKVYSIQSQNGVLKDQMTSIRKYGSVNVSATVFEAASIMKDKGISTIVILDADNHFYGFMTKEFISDLFGAGLITKATPIKNIKEKFPYIKAAFLSKDTLMEEVIKKIQSNGAEFVIVVNRDNSVCGVFPCKNLL